MRWYALHIASCCEAIVARKLTEAGIESYYPATLEHSRRKYRPDIEHKWFPGYVFAHFKLSEKTAVVAISQVITILGFAGHAVAVPDAQIEAVHLMTDNSANANLASCPSMVAGEAVVVRRGPFQNLEGFITYVKGQARLVVSIELLHQSISVEVDTGDVELVLPQAA